MLPSDLLHTCGGSGGSSELQHCAGRQWIGQKGDSDWSAEEAALLGHFFYEKSNKKNFRDCHVDPPTVKRMLPTNEKTSRKKEEKDQNKNDNLECGDEYL